MWTKPGPTSGSCRRSCARARLFWPFAYDVRVAVSKQGAETSWAIVFNCSSFVWTSCQSQNLSQTLPPLSLTSPRMWGRRTSKRCEGLPFRRAFPRAWQDARLIPSDGHRLSALSPRFQGRVRYWWELGEVVTSACVTLNAPAFILQEPKLHFLKFAASLALHLCLFKETTFLDWGFSSCCHDWALAAPQKGCLAASQGSNRPDEFLHHC